MKRRKRRRDGRGGGRDSDEGKKAEWVTRLGVGRGGALLLDSKEVVGKWEEGERMNGERERDSLVSRDPHFLGNLMEREQQVKGLTD